MPRAAKVHPNQTPLFAEPGKRVAVLAKLEPPSAAGSETSQAAARSMRRPAPRYREQVLYFIARQGAAGATSDEVQAALGLSHQNGSARVSELAKYGFVVDSGVRRVTRSGRKAVVYVVPGVAVVIDDVAAPTTPEQRSAVVEWAKTNLPSPDAMHGAGDGFGGSDF